MRRAALIAALLAGATALAVQLAEHSRQTGEPARPSAVERQLSGTGDGRSESPATASRMTEAAHAQPEETLHSTDSPPAGPTDAFRSVDLSDEALAALESELLDVVSQELGADEARFRFSLAGVRDWALLKEMIAERSAATGADYNTLLLDAGLQSGDITADEIRDIVARGHPLPDSAISDLARHGQADTIVTLVEDGIIANTNRVSMLTGDNTLSTYIKSAGRYPYKLDAAEAASGLEKLIALGIETQPQHDGPDPLDQALAIVTDRNIGIKLELVRVLLDNGVPVEDSHRETVYGMRDGPNKEKLIEALGEYL